MCSRQKRKTKNGSKNKHNNGYGKESKRPTDKDCKKPRGFKQKHGAQTISGKNTKKKGLSWEEKQRLSTAKMFSKTFHPEKPSGATALAQ